MHRLLTASPSPFGHKVQCAALLVGLQLQVEQVSTLEENSELRRLNPLGKLPVLVPPDAEAIWDSRVIIDYLQSRSGNSFLVPVDHAQRLQALQLQALADGLADAAILLYAEFQWREPCLQNPHWMAHQAGKITRSLEQLERAPPSKATDRPDVGEIALACTLHYLERRFGRGMRIRWPRTFGWRDASWQAIGALQASAPPEVPAPHLKAVASQILFAQL